MSDALTKAASSAGAPYDLTPTDVLAYVALGEQRHGEARQGECGAAHPTLDRQWCREPAGHAGDHSPVASPPEHCGVLLNPPDPYEWCERPPGRDHDHERLSA